MFGNRWQLFRFRGIPVSVDASWLIILALVTLTTASGFPNLMQQYFGEAAAMLPPFEYWIMGLIAALAFFACIVLHELGHAIVGRARGIPIAGITLFLFGGVSELQEEPTSAGSEFVMAIAGPVVSLVLGIAFALLTWAGYDGGWAPLVVMVLGYLSFINLLVLAFNLIPAFPLDGGRVLRSILWAKSGNLRWATFWAARGGQAFAWVLIAWGIVQFFAGNWLGGIWSGLIGLFLNAASQSSYEQLLIRKMLQGEPVRRFMNPHPIAVPRSLDLHHWVDEYVYRLHHKTFPVASDGRLEGFISTKALTNVPRCEWDRLMVGHVMDRDFKSISISPDADALGALEKMQRGGVTRLLVAQGDRLVGIISLSDLLRFLNLKIELEGSEETTSSGEVQSITASQRRETLSHSK